MPCVFCTVVYSDVPSHVKVFAHCCACEKGARTAGVIIANGCLCVAWSLLLRLVMYSTDGSPFVLPSLIGLTCIVFQIVVWASGYSEADAQNAGWLISELLEVPVHWWSEMSLISSPLFLEFHPWAIFNAQNLNIWQTMTVMLLLNGSFNMISATKALGVASRVDLNRRDVHFRCTIRNADMFVVVSGSGCSGSWPCLSPSCHCWASVFCSIESTNTPVEPLFRAYQVRTSLLGRSSVNSAS